MLRSSAMRRTKYINALILPAHYRPSPTASAPGRPGDIAAMQYDCLAPAPHSLTTDDLISVVPATRKQAPEGDMTTLREGYFSKGQPCLRASPLTKTLGWAVHHDADRRIALVDPASAQFAALCADPEITKHPAMRNKRA